MGTLGGGNHFIEIDESDFGEKYLVIHTGSRNLGVQVADFYQDLADQLVNHDLEGYYKKRDEILTTYSPKQCALSEGGDVAILDGPFGPASVGCIDCPHPANFIQDERSHLQFHTLGQSECFFRRYSYQ